MLAGCGRFGFDPADARGNEASDAALGPGCAAQISLGFDHSCAVRTDGELFCWGANTAGQLGIGSLASTFDASEVIANNVQRMFVGPDHACAVLASGLVCWGRNLSGELGDGTTKQRTTPTPIVGPAADQVVTDGDAGEGFTCAIIAGEAWCWGDNSRGQLGDGTTTPHAIPAPVGSNGQPPFGAVALGASHACALGTNGTVWCWGANTDGELGNGTTTDRSVPTLVTGFTATALAAGGHNSCAINGAQVFCWGTDANGQLGNDLPLQSSSTPVVVAIGTVPAIASIGLGTAHGCAVIGDGTARCWGRHNGRLGDGDPMPMETVNAVPVTVSNLTDAVQIAVGQDSTCARRVSGAVDCWGQNDSGELARGSFASSNVPVTSTVTGAVQLAMGGYRACSINAAGRLACWGSNAQGELGNGGATDEDLPMRVAPGVRNVAAGSSFTCAAFEDGVVRCWGKPTTGRLGIGAPGSVARVAPTPIQAPAALTNAVAVSAGTSGACAQNVDGTLFCWGGNSSGEVGDGTTSQRNAPVAVTIPAGPVVEIAKGQTHACARAANGSVWCWGAGGGGRLGNGTATASPSPVQVTPASSGPWMPTAIDLGEDHSCARDAAGTLWCWGANAEGALGDGTTTNRSTPKATILGAVETFATGSQITCGVVAGVVSCWGEADVGKLGDGTTMSRGTPGVVPGLPAATFIASGSGDHTCAIDIDKRVWCWGEGNRGQSSGSHTTALGPRAVAIPCP